MKYSITTLAIILSLFLVAQFVGLAVNNNFLIKEELPYGLEPIEMEPGISPWFLISAIIIISVLMFFFMKSMKFDFLMKIWFFLVVLLCISIALSAFMSSTIAFLVALSITILKFKEFDVYIHNLGEILVYGGVVVIFAPMFNFIAVILLLFLISIYDYIAVFITKHMVGLAKMQQKLGIFSGLLVPHKGEVAVLGGGDIAFTLLFASVILREFNMFSAILSIIGATIFIGTLMLLGKKGEFYPAMPFVTAGCLLGLLISII